MNVGSLGEDNAEELEDVVKKALAGLVNLVTQVEKHVLNCYQKSLLFVEGTKGFARRGVS